MGRVVLTALLDPARAARELEDNEPFAAAALVFCLAALSFAVNQLLVCRATMGYGAGAAFMIFAFLVNLGLGCVLVVGGLCFISFFIHMLGGRVRMGRMTWALILSFAPWMLSSPLALVAVALGGALGVLVAVPGHLLLFSWFMGILGIMVGQICEKDLLSSLISVAMSVGLASVLMWAASFSGFLFWMNFLVALSPPAP